MTADLAVLVLAAGASRRFGLEDKLLAPIGGRPMARHVFDLAAEIAADQRLAVVATDEVASQAREAGLITVRTQAEGNQSDSLKAGLAAIAPGPKHVLILLGDMPWLTRVDIDRLLAHGSPACARLDGQRLPPALLPLDALKDAASLSGDQGARRWLTALAETDCLALDPTHLRDVDRPEDLSGPQGEKVPVR